MEPISTTVLLRLAFHLVRLVANNADEIAKVFRLAWTTVTDWLTSRKVAVGDVGKLVKQQLDSGSYRVVGGVFSASGQVRQQTTWECTELDEELRRRLYGRSELTIEL